MKPLICSSGLKKIASFISSATLVAICFGSIPALAIPASRGREQNQIAQTLVSMKRSQQRWIEIDLSDQRLIAWEGSTPTLTVTVSSGKPETPTITGVFTVQSKHVSTRMRGEGYNTPYVPYTMYFSGGYAIHGAYWHNRFGTPVSHGCVNLPVAQAQQLFDWASVGTTVIVHP
jgi:lipoprotein-anchoring transpeptidase ErfK/SrfK